MKLLIMLLHKPHATSSILGPNILLSTQISDTPNHVISLAWEKFRPLKIITTSNSNKRTSEWAISKPILVS